MKINIETELVKKEYHKLISKNPLRVIKFITYKNTYLEKEILDFTEEHKSYLFYKRIGTEY